MMNLRELCLTMTAALESRRAFLPSYPQDVRQSNSPGIDRSCFYMPPERRVVRVRALK